MQEKDAQAGDGKGQDCPCPCECPVYRKHRSRTWPYRRPTAYAAYDVTVIENEMLMRNTARLAKRALLQVITLGSSSFVPRNTVIQNILYTEYQS